MILDISPLVSPRLAVWPGDTPPSREVLCDMKAGANLTLSTLRATVHLGAHADAPSHYGRDAASIDAVSLDAYVGPCRVIRVAVARGARIPASAVPQGPLPPRLLLRTDTYPDPERFDEDFAALDPALVDVLHARGVILVGIDTPSVDLFSSKDLPAHGRFLAHGMAILEGLVLRDVPEGDYDLIALPLKLEGFDASPVRAVLRK
ncbi:MAG TPA: cyclase family protein [Candidatus Polarisedimenticolaceae bacterium]